MFQNPVRKMAIRKLAAILVLAGCTPLAAADVLLIDRLEQSRQVVPERPGRGMTMERVESTYGAPQARRAAVGDPPITRWEYANFIVYFEHNQVIHAVARR